MFKSKIYILFSLSLILAGCQFRQEEYVDFTNIEAANGLSFKVISQYNTDLKNGLPDDCYLPDGTQANRYGTADETQTDLLTLNLPRKTSSVTSTDLVTQLLKYGNQNKVIEIVGTYPSYDNNLSPITLSGKVLLPLGKKPKRMILVSHYTICADREAPSNSFPLEGILVKSGYGLIIPDYMGYGVTTREHHPYLVMEQTARNVIDMYLAVRPWLKAVGMEPEYDDIYLMGYSQGGASTMAVEYMIETKYNIPEEDNYIKVRRVFAGAGPYDIKATYDQCVETGTTSYPVAIPLVVQGMINGSNLDIKIDDIIQKGISENLDEWINSKRYTTTEINKLINTTYVKDILTEEGMSHTSEKVQELYNAMALNSITSYNWTPMVPVYIMHSKEDEVVPYTNATIAMTRWKDANILYDFDYYGGHVKTGIKFIYSVQSLLKEEEKSAGNHE